MMDEILDKNGQNCTKLHRVGTKRFWTKLDKLHITSQNSHFWGYGSDPPYPYIFEPLEAPKTVFLGVLWESQNDPFLAVFGHPCGSTGNATRVLFRPGPPRDPPPRGGARGPAGAPPGGPPRGPPGPPGDPPRGPPFWTPLGDPLWTPMLTYCGYCAGGAPVPPAPPSTQKVHWDAFMSLSCDMDNASQWTGNNVAGCCDLGATSEEVIGTSSRAHAC